MNAFDLNLSARTYFEHSQEYQGESSMPRYFLIVGMAAVSACCLIANADEPKAADSLNSALGELWLQKLTVAEREFLKNIWADAGDESPFVKDVQGIVVASKGRDRNIALLPLSVSFVIRYPVEEFPKTKERGILESDVGESEFCVFLWDKDGKLAHDASIKSRSVTSSFRLADESISRPCIDIILLFELQFEPKDMNDAIGSIHHLKLEYEFADSAWRRVMPDTSKTGNP